MPLARLLRLPEALPAAQNVAAAIFARAFRRFQIFQRGADDSPNGGSSGNFEASSLLRSYRLAPTPGSPPASFAYFG